MSVVLTLRPVEDCAIPMTLGAAVHGCFLQLVAQQDGRLAEHLHAAEREKPFTVSPLQGAFTVRQGQILLTRHQTYWLRFTSLTPTLSDLLLSLTPQSTPTLSLSGRDFEVTAIISKPAEHRWASTASFAQLYEARIPGDGPVPTKLPMRFFSPTTFRSGRYHLLEPLPRLVFFALAEKWNRYAPIHVGSGIADLVDELVGLARYELRTNIFDFGRYRNVGFVGQ